MGVRLLTWTGWGPGNFNWTSHKKWDITPGEKTN